MLLANIGVNVSQPEITEVAGATHTIETHGSRVDQLAKAVQQLVPIARLWFKEKASLSEPHYQDQHFHEPLVGFQRGQGPPDR